MASRRPRVPRWAGQLEAKLWPKPRPGPSGKGGYKDQDVCHPCIFLALIALPKAMNTCCPHQLHGPHSVCQVIRGHGRVLAQPEPL